MIRKVVYINYQPITAKYYSDYYLGECVDNGFSVEYWDVSNLYFPNTKCSESNNLITTVKKITSLNELKRYVIQVDIDSTFFITNITYEFRVWKLFRILTSFNCKLAFFARGMFPSPVNANSTSKVINLILSFKFKRIIEGVKNRVAIFLKKYKIIKTYDFVFRAGSEGGLTIGFGNNFDMINAEINEINYFDYDKYLSVIKSNAVIKNGYCVFIDQYLANHPDIVICGLKNVDADIYYSDLNTYFDFIEKTHNITIVIAAHPKAVEYQTNNPFQGRQIIFDKTCELVKDSKFVLTHHSTAISYPILFKKPILFLNSDELKKAMPDLYDLTIFFANYLNCEVVNFDKFDASKKLDLYVDIDIYNDYSYKFLTSKESESKLSSEIFIETILSL
nr:hypothetical protein [uncultured Flavobacterium sp.]